MFRANLHPINYACNSTILTCEIIIYIYIYVKISRVMIVVKLVVDLKNKEL